MKNFTIITIFDNYSVNRNLKTGWGYSALIKVDNQNILFDAGADSTILLSNMKKLEIDPQEINFVFISHLHDDHTAGLSKILKIKPSLKVYKPKSYSNPHEIIKGVWTTGSMGISIKEQSLILDSKKGLIIITGCAHPGIIKIIKKAKEMFSEKNIYLVLGGFHLFKNNGLELKKIITDFKKLKVKNVAACHCSGDKSRQMFRKEYKNNFIENGVGKIIKA